LPSFVFPHWRKEKKISNTRHFYGTLMINKTVSTSFRYCQMFKKFASILKRCLFRLCHFSCNQLWDFG
jgi:hypothetical protein